MPVTKPTDLASWGSTSSNIVVPSAGAANPGFATGAQVPSGWLNWFMSTVSKWIAWLNAFESQAHTWTALQTFNSLSTPVSIKQVGNDSGVTTLAAGVAGSEPTGGEKLSYWQEPTGTVHIVGDVRLSAGATSHAIFSGLPAGMRPASVVQRVGNWGSGLGLFHVDNAGNVYGESIAATPISSTQLHFEITFNPGVAAAP